VVRDLRKKIGSEFVVNVSGIGYRLRWIYLINLGF
jgi:DNA-binding response OmpR family regulator